MLTSLAAGKKEEDHRKMMCCVTYPIDRRFSGPAFMTSKAPMAYCVKLKTAINSIGKVEMESSQTF